jgi:hypothetical protein
MENLKPNKQRAKGAINFIWLILIFEIQLLIFEYFGNDLIETSIYGGEISTKTLTLQDLTEMAYFIVSIISIVTFIQWFRRAYFNLHTRVNQLSHNEGWAAGSWFVPIINLYRPYQIMKELYQETKKLLLTKLNINEKLSTRPLAWWWTLWILSIAIEIFAGLYSTYTESINELIQTTARMIGNIVSILLALITIKVIKDYSSIEPLLREIKDEEETIYA